VNEWASQARSLFFVSCVRQLAYFIHSPLFSGTDGDDLRALADQAELRPADAGDIVIRAGMPQAHIVFLAKGKLAIYRRNKASDIALLLGMLEAPSLFGDAELYAGVPWMASARAETDVVCLMLPTKLFDDIVGRNVALAARLYRDASARHMLANHTAQTVVLYDVEVRIFRLLLDYAYRYGRREGDNAIIERPISQVEMAAALGVNRKTIARTLKPLEEAGTVVRTDGEESWQIVGLARLEARLPKQLLGLSSRFGETPESVLSRWTDDMSRDDTN
jgi:CRP-like cAMP-binding protein